METMQTEQNTIVLPETKERVCSFSLCCKCCDGVCTLDPTVECEYEIQHNLLSDWFPAIVKAHIEHDSNVVKIRAEGAAFMLQHSGNLTAAEKLMQLVQEIKPEKKRTEHHNYRQAALPLQPAPAKANDETIGFHVYGADSAHGLKFEMDFREVLDRSEDEEVVRYATAYWKILHREGINTSAIIKGKNEGDIIRALCEMEPTKLKGICNKLFIKTVSMWLSGGEGVNGAKSIITEKLRPVFHADD